MEKEVTEIMSQPLVMLFNDNGSNTILASLAYWFVRTV